MTAVPNVFAGFIYGEPRRPCVLLYGVLRWAFTVVGPAAGSRRTRPADSTARCGRASGRWDCHSALHCARRCGDDERTVAGVKSGPFPYTISIRFQDDETIIFDDLLSMRCAPVARMCDA
jgi:hypothetical protein